MASEPLSPVSEPISSRRFANRRSAANDQKLYLRLSSGHHLCCRSGCDRIPTLQQIVVDGCTTSTVASNRRSLASIEEPQTRKRRRRRGKLLLLHTSGGCYESVSGECCDEQSVDFEMASLVQREFYATTTTIRTSQSPQAEGSDEACERIRETRLLQNRAARFGCKTGVSGRNRRGRSKSVGAKLLDVLILFPIILLLDNMLCDIGSPLGCHAFPIEEPTTMPTKFVAQSIRRAPPAKMLIYEGDNVTLPCEINNQFGNAYWSRTDHARYGHQYLFVTNYAMERTKDAPPDRYSVDQDLKIGTNNLNIRNILLNESGTYECDITTLDDHRHKPFRLLTELEVMPRPTTPAPSTTSSTSTSATITLPATHHTSAPPTESTQLQPRAIIGNESQQQHSSTLAASTLDPTHRYYPAAFLTPNHSAPHHAAAGTNLTAAAGLSSFSPVLLQWPLPVIALLLLVANIFLILALLKRKRRAKKLKLIESGSSGGASSGGGGGNSGSGSSSSSSGGSSNAESAATTSSRIGTNELSCTVELEQELSPSQLDPLQQPAEREPDEKMAMQLALAPPPHLLQEHPAHLDLHYQQLQEHHPNSLQVVQFPIVEQVRLTQPVWNGWVMQI